jgi:alcohol dehydrogenase (cytochrome c)
MGVAVVALAPGLALAAEPAAVLSYTPAQAKAGEPLYQAHCASCHGERLNDGEATPLAGQTFQAKWNSKPLLELFTRTRSTMPATAPASLSNEQYANILAFMFRRNNFLSGTRPLPTDPAQMRAMVLPAVTNMFGQLEPDIILPPSPNPTPNPLDKYTSVTDKDIQNPKDEDWLSWRRTVTADGYSPLNQINTSNVGKMQLAWSWSLPNGANEATPLVHNGVIFVHGFGDYVQALNAKTGDRLWEYARVLPEGVAPSFKKSLTLYGDYVYTATSDAHIVALNAKTGEVVWDMPAAEGGTINSGPLIANGKIVVGALRVPRIKDSKEFSNRRGVIVGMDAKTGKKLWQFETIPGPEEPGGDTWNNLPIEQRTGGSIWAPGSYDPETNLVFFGPAPTYDTGPLRIPAKPGDKRINSALYTNSTVALNPDTGKLVWHYQHLANDQYDLDWGFERHIMNMPVNGKMRRVVVTAGKPAIHDVLDAKTGEYISSWDLGFQNFITNIDPKTGEKTQDPNMMPGDGKSIFVCPHIEGGKNWIPSAVNPSTHILYVPIVEACMVLSPAPEGERGILTGYRAGLAPRKDTDGNYGRFQAIDLVNKKVLWVDRQRAPYMSGVLATGGGLVFAGSLDRQFIAFDSANGKRLWKTRLNEVPNSAPITYSVDGKQYIAVVVGGGGNHSMLFRPLVPEFTNPVNRSSTLWVFEVPNP